MEIVNSKNPSVVRDQAALLLYIYIRSSVAKTCDLDMNYVAKWSALRMRLFGSLEKMNLSSPA